MTTGVIGAMEEEIKHLFGITSVEKTVQKAGMVFSYGCLENRPIVIVRSGIGKVNAALCAQILIETFQVKRIVFIGVAGAILPQLKIGDLVISSDSMYHDVDVTAFGYPRGQLPRFNVHSFPADPELISFAKKSAATIEDCNVFVGRVLTGDRFISAVKAAEFLAVELGGICTEMEGAGVGQACYLYNIPYVLIRSISDRADGVAPRDYSQFYLKAARVAVKVVSGILKQL